MIIQKLLLLVVPLLLLVEAQNNQRRAFTDRIAFRRPVRPEFKPVEYIRPIVVEYLKPSSEFSEVDKGANIPITPKSYVDITKSVTSETKNSDITINSAYSGSDVSSTPLGIGQPTRKPLWSKRTSTSYFSRRLTDTPTTARTQKTFRTQYVTSQPTEPIEPYTISAVTNEPLTLEIVKSQPKIYDVITPQKKPDRISYTSNVPRSVWTVATTELPQSTTYTQSVLDTTESSTQADVVSNEKETEVFTTFTPSPTSKPHDTVFTTDSTTTEDPTTQSVIKSSYTTNQLHDYTCRNVNEYYSVANQCNEYVECENNIAHWHICPEGLHFDSKKIWPAFPCAYPFEVVCQSQSITSINNVDVLPKISEIINGPVSKSAELETVKPEQTIYDYSDYSTPTPEPPTRKPLWSRNTYTSNVPISVWTVATTEIPESNTYTQSELDTTESSTQADVVSNEKETEVFSIVTPSPTSKPQNIVFATTPLTTEDPTTQSIINFTTRPITSLKPKSSYTVNQLYDYTCRNVNEYYSVANQCNEYVECENNIAQWHICPEGLHFDSKKKWPAFPCAYPFEVQCQSQSITSINNVDVLPKISEIINGPVSIFAELETVEPEKTIYDYSDYSTPTPEQSTRKPLWSRYTYTSNVPRSVWTVATTEPPESNTYTQSELDTTESSTQADVVSNEKETEVFSIVTPSPTSKPQKIIFATTPLTTKDPTTQSIINFTTRPITSLKPKSSYTANQLYDYTCRNVNEYYSVANQCNEYVECENNIAHWHICPEGLHFDSKKKWPAFPCAYPFEVVCQSQSITSISDVDVLPKRSGIINEPVAKSAELGTVKPEKTMYDYSDYSTPGPEQPTRKPLWSRQTIQISSDIPTTTVTQKSYEPPFSSYMRTTYAIFNPQETMEYNTNNIIYEPATSESVTSVSYENLPDDISSTYMQPETETPEPSTLPNESKDDVSNETPTEVSVTYISPQTVPDISIPNIISPSSTSRPEIIVTNQESTSEPNLYELPAQATTEDNQPINTRPTWNFPSRPSYAALATTSTTTTTIKPITQSIIDFTTRPTVSQKPLHFYSVNLLNDYTCRDVNGYYSVANQCDEYIQCENNKAYRNLCPDGLHFNPKAEWPAYPCAYPSEVKCHSQSITQQAQPTDQCYHRYGIFPTSNGDCGHFIMCQEGLATLMSCPSGLAFNPITSTCDWPVNVPDCNLDVFQDFTCPSNDYALISHFITYYKYENSCKQYIICQEGRPRLLSCDAGLSFDEKTNQCVNSDLIENCQNYTNK